MQENVAGAAPPRPVPSEPNRFLAFLYLRRSSGGRPRARDRSFITLAQGLDVVNGFRLAEHRGTPLSGSLTVAYRGSRFWKKGPSTPEEVATCHEQVLRRLRRFCQRRFGIEASYVYSIENPPGGGRGPHGHYAIYLPGGEWARLDGPERAERKAEFQRNLGALEKTIRSLGKWDSDACAGFDPVQVGYCSVGAGAGWVGYCLKGLNPDIVVDLPGGKRLPLGNSGLQIVNQGDPRISKRAATSQSLGPTQRKNAAGSGFSETQDLGGFLSSVPQRKEKVRPVPLDTDIMEGSPRKVARKPEMELPSEWGTWA